MGNKFEWAGLPASRSAVLMWVVTSKNHQSWFEMLMGGEGEIIGIEAPSRHIGVVTRDNSCS